MTGDARRLGAWNPLQGLYLRTDKNDWPTWRSDPIPVEQLYAGANNPPMLEYKYVILDLNDRSNPQSQWEAFQGNRTVLLSQTSATKDGGLIKLRDKFNEKKDEEPLERRTSQLDQMAGIGTSSASMNVLPIEPAISLKE